MERTVARIAGEQTYITPKTKGSRRTVPQTSATTTLLRDYLAAHPRRGDQTAPLFPGMRLLTPRRTGVRAEATDLGHTTASALRQARASADLSAEEAAARLMLDWTQPLNHAAFYKAVYRPAVLRANRLTPTAALPPALKFHALRHTYASLCVAAGVPPLQLSRFMGHAKVTTTLAIYTHLFEDDHADAMAALGAMDRQPVADVGNVVALLAPR